MNRTRLITLVVLIALIGWFGWGLYASARQARPNQQLAAAVKNFDVPTVKRLLDEGADPNTRESSVPPPTWRERFEIISGHRPKRDSGIPILVDAVSWSEDCPPTCDRQIDIAKMLIARGVDINAKEGNGDTALMIAIGLGHSECARLLIDNGADVNTNNEYHETPLLVARSVQDAQISRLLIEHGADANAHERGGITPLMLSASLAYQPDIVRLLIAHGVNVNAQSDDGATSLMLAAEWSVPEIVRILIDHSADVNARDEKGHTVLWHARHANSHYLQSGLIGIPPAQKQVTALLVQHGARE